MQKEIEAGNHKLNIEKIGTRHVVRLENGYALSLGATREHLDLLIERVKSGEEDDYIRDHCEGGRLAST